MKYDWEKSVEKWRGEIRLMLPPGIILVGVAVANTRTGEGAIASMLTAEQMGGDVIAADMAQDILGDARALYNDAVVTFESNLGRGDKK